MPRRLRVLLAVAFLLVGCSYAAADDAVRDWNAFLISITVPPPPATARPANEIGIAAAYMNIAIYDAVVAIDGGYKPFATTVLPASRGASREAAIAAAANRILTALYPAFTAAITAHYDAAVNAVTDADARAAGIESDLPRRMAC